MAGTDDVRRDFVELWGRLGSFWGVPPTTARVYGWLLSRAEPSTADEIVAGLGMSRGAVSMACRELLDWGLVHVERGANGRRRAWRPETDLEKAMRNIVAARKRREWDPILEHLREWIPALEADRSEEALVFRERLESIESLVGTADAMARSFLGGGMVQRLGLKALVAAAKRRKAPWRGVDGAKGGRR
jgi:DNA-binding transcriptional regulator GbsR (MarR family)